MLLIFNMFNIAFNLMGLYFSWLDGLKIDYKAGMVLIFTVYYEIGHTRLEIFAVYLYIDISIHFGGEIFRSLKVPCLLN